MTILISSRMLELTFERPNRDIHQMSSREVISFPKSMVRCSMVSCRFIKGQLILTFHRFLGYSHALHLALLALSVIVRHRFVLPLRQQLRNDSQAIRAPH